MKNKQTWEKKKKQPTTKNKYKGWPLYDKTASPQASQMRQSIDLLHFKN